MFYHENLDFPELKANMTEKGRFYETPDGKKYPSVTTIIGAASDNTWLDEWKARVGEEEVRRISGQATRRGTAVHEITEQYIRNNPNYAKGHMPANIASFRYIKPLLDKHLTKVYGLELPLFSHTLRAAGRVDLVGVWDGVLSIVDFKTSKKKKERDDIHTYFTQESAYAMMFFERTGLLPTQLVTVMTVDDSEPLLFIERAKDWIPKFIEMREKVDF